MSNVRARSHAVFNVIRSRFHGGIVVSSLRLGPLGSSLKEKFGEQFAVLENLSLYRPDVGLTWSDPAFLDPAGLII